MSARSVPPACWNDLRKKRRGLVTWPEIESAGQVGVARSRLASGQWQRVAPAVYATFPEPLDVQQLRIVAVLHAGSGGVLVGMAVLLGAGLKDEMPHTLDVSAPHYVRRWAPATYHRHRQPLDVVAGVVPTVPLGLAAVQAVGWAPSSGQATTLLRMAVQQRVVTAEAVASFVGRRTYRRHLVLDVLQDVAGGATTSAEARLRRAWDARPNLPVMRMQLPFVGHDGRTRLFDAAFCPDDFPGLTITVVLELDGRHHREAAVAEDDDARSLAAARARIHVLRVSNRTVQAAVGTVVDDVLAVLRAYGWDGTRPT